VVRASFIGAGWTRGEHGVHAAVLAVAALGLSPVRASSRAEAATLPVVSVVPTPSRVEAREEAHDEARPALPVPSYGRVVQYRLRNGTRPPDDRPNAWVYVPRAFDPAAPLRVTILFRGFKNCIRSYVSAEGKRCRPGGRIRTGYDVPAQVERSGTRAIMVVPELAYDEPSSDPGRLGEPLALRAFLRELVEEALRPVIGARRYEDVDRVALVASSGGYQALLPALAHGGVEAVRDVYLLDAMYVEAQALDAFLAAHLHDLRPDAPRPARFALIYCRRGSGTRRESLGFGARAVRRMTEAGQREHVLAGAEEESDEEGAPLAALRAPVVVLETPRMHDTIVRDYLWKLLAASEM
jgi:hypothetical protein